MSGSLDALDAAWELCPEARPALQAIEAALQRLGACQRLDLSLIALPPVGAAAELQAAAARLALSGTLSQPPALLWLAAILEGLEGRWGEAARALGMVGWRLEPPWRAALERDRLLASLGQGDVSAFGLLAGQRELRVAVEELFPGLAEARPAALEVGPFGLRARLRWGSREGLIVRPLAAAPGSEAALARLQGLSHPGLAPLAEVLAGGQAWLFEAGAPVRLTSVEAHDLLSRRATLGRLASGLVALHEAGLCHGAVSAGALEREGFIGPLRWTGAQPGVTGAALRAILDERPAARLLVTSLDPRVLAGTDADAAADAWAFGALFADWPGLQHGPEAQQLLAACRGDDLAARAAALREVASWDDAPVAATLSPSAPAWEPPAPTPAPAPSEEATARRQGSAVAALFKEGLRIIEAPRDRAEACLLADAAERLDAAIRNLFGAGERRLAELLMARRPAPSILARRRDMVLIEGGDIELADGGLSFVRSFLVERDVQPYEQLLRRDAERLLGRRRLAFPTLEQWVRLLDVRPDGMTYASREFEWLRQVRRSGRRILGEAIGFGLPVWFGPEKPIVKVWLPGHRPGLSISTRGVVELFPPH